MKAFIFHLHIFSIIPSIKIVENGHVDIFIASIIKGFLYASLACATFHTVYRSLDMFHMHSSCPLDPFSLYSFL